MEPQQVWGGNADNEALDDEKKHLIATIYGEAAGCSPAAREAIANVVMNRVGKGEWEKQDTVDKVIKNTGFDAYSDQNEPYRTAMSYLDNRDGSNQDIERLIKVALPVYNRETPDITGGAVLYYSPQTQAISHVKRPDLYDEIPDWDFNKLEEVKVPGTEQDDFKFFRYK
jgi:hypothetical protein